MSLYLKLANLVIEENAAGNNCSINTLQLRSGVYIFRIMTEEGFTTKQVVIK